MAKLNFTVVLCHYDMYILILSEDADKVGVNNRTCGCHQTPPVVSHVILWLYSCVVEAVYTAPRLSL